MTVLGLIAGVLIFLVGVLVGQLVQQQHPSVPKESLTKSIERLIGSLSVGSGYMVIIQRRQEGESREPEPSDEWELGNEQWRNN